jgi:hypothetical protein
MAGSMDKLRIYVSFKVVHSRAIVISNGHGINATCEGGWQGMTSVLDLDVVAGLGIFYVGTGFGIALASLLLPLFRRHLLALGDRLGMSGAYAQTIWCVGTVLFWPVGLHAWWTGRILPWSDDTPPPVSPAQIERALTAMEASLGDGLARSSAGSEGWDAPARDRVTVDVTQGRWSAAMTSALDAALGGEAPRPVASRPVGGALRL